MFIKTITKAIILLGLSLIPSLSFIDIAWATGSQQDEAVDRVAIYHDGTSKKLSALDDDGKDLSDWFNDIPQTDFPNGLRGETMTETQSRVSVYVEYRHGRVREIIWPKLLTLGLQSALYTYRQQFTVPFPVGTDLETFYINYSLLVRSDGNYSILQARVLPQKPTFLVVHHTGRNSGLGDLPTTMPPASHQDLLILNLINTDGDKVKITPDDYVMTLVSPAYHPPEWELADGVLTRIRDKHDCLLGTLDPEHRAIAPYVPETPQVYLESSGVEAATLTIAKVVCDDKNIQDILDDPTYRVRSAVGVYLGALENYALADEPTQRITSRELRERGCGLDNEYTNKWQVGIEPHADIYYYSLSPATRDVNFLQLSRYTNSDEREWFADATETLRESFVELEVDAKIMTATVPSADQIVYPLDWNSDVVAGTLLAASSVTLSAPLPRIFKQTHGEDTITVAEREIVLESNAKCGSNLNCWGNTQHSNNFPLRTTFYVRVACGNDILGIEAWWTVGDGLPEAGKIYGFIDRIGRIQGKETNIFSNSNPKGIRIYFDGFNTVKAEGIFLPGENPGCSDDNPQGNRPSEGAYSYLSASETVRVPVRVRQRYCSGGLGKDNSCRGYSYRWVQGGGRCTQRCGKDGTQCCRYSPLQYTNRTTCPNLANAPRRTIDLLSW